MLLSILSLCLIILLTFLPVILWGYIFSILIDESLLRARWWIGVMTGVFVTLGAILIGGLTKGDAWIGGGLLFLFLFAVSTLLSLIIREIGHAREIRLREILSRLILHSCIFSILFGLALSSSDLVMSGLFGGWFTAITSATLEEGSKHLGTLSTRTDRDHDRLSLFLLTIAVVLGFSWIENILYLIHTFSLDSIEKTLGLWIDRSIFSLSTHLLAGLIVSYGWSRAMRYPLGSPRYILLVGASGVLAIALHGLYNTLVSGGYTLSTLLFFFVSMVGIGWMLYGQEGVKSEE